MTKNSQESQPLDIERLVKDKSSTGKKERTSFNFDNEDKVEGVEKVDVKPSNTENKKNVSTKVKNDTTTDTKKAKQTNVSKVDSSYYEPLKSAKLSEDVLTKVKILTPFLQSEHGYDLRANNSFIDIMIDYYIENGLDKQENKIFHSYYNQTVKK